jgi:ribonuclease Y
VLKIKKAEPEISELVGKLNFRTSYTQNQWRHAVEAAHLAGMMAGELGLEAKVAVRGALLHDIGKALTHEVEGSHALIGAELARKHGETAVVANAIGYHHGEEPLESAYAPLVAAADALSGGRPGARREAVDTYGDRIEELEHIASGFKGVTQVYAVQGGREIRVRVNNERVNEASLAELSQEIALKISDEMVFPGQIRVTVIREFCATEFAN